MMIRCERSLLGEGPLTVAVSGGRDSMAALDYLRRSRPVTAAVFDHGTGLHSQVIGLIEHYCGRWGSPLIVGSAGVSAALNASSSPEDQWRAARYQWLNSLEGTVVLAHHLGDAVETWLWSCVHGTPKHLPWTRGKCVRPFLLTDRSGFTNWCTRFAVPWADDPANSDSRYQRVRVREQLAPAAAAVNPGIAHTVARALRRRLAQELS